jgi:soluble lytic murein transglycosylase-like protein
MLKLFSKLDWWQQLAVLLCVPLLSLNLAVAFFGSSVVFPLSPFFVREKASALWRYALHRPGCALRFGHGELGPIVEAAERHHRLPHGLMRAIVDVESGSRAHRISFAGAMGPAQLMPGTARMLQVRDPFDPQSSIEAGAGYLKSLLDKTHDVRLAVAAYNAGPGNVSGHVPHNGETEVYVARVMEKFRAP